jgi:DNA replication protein DnaC
MRRTAPEVLATARAQRWDPAEVLKLLLGEEVAGRERSALATRRVEAAFPTGKTFATWDQGLSSIPTPTQTALRTLEWMAYGNDSCIFGPFRPLQD